MASLAATGVLALALLSRTVQADCESYGVDFQDGGSYFQNITSTDPFTFVSIFEGCQPDTCDNILVDPNGDEYQCSDTNLTPDDTNQLSTCPIDKDQMFSGDWSVILISNNGDADPIAYERDFYLTVGVPATVTYTPTVTVSSTSTPIFSQTSTSNSLSTITAVVTVTSASITRKPTITTTPARVTTTRTVTLGTIYDIAVTVVPYVITRVHTATCSIPPKQRFPDPTATITPTLVTAAALTPTAAASNDTSRRRDNARRVPSDRAVRIAERKARLEAARLDKRAPDSATTTISITDPADFSTSTAIITAATTTVTVTQINTIFTTTTSTSTTLSGTTTLPVVTITAPTPTKTNLAFTIVTQALFTLTQRPLVTVTSTTTPTAVLATCSAKGGVIS